MFILTTPLTASSIVFYGSFHIILIFSGRVILVFVLEERKMSKLCEWVFEKITLFVSVCGQEALYIPPCGRT